MIRELLTPEAQADAYVWAAVLLAHAGIGVALWVLCMAYTGHMRGSAVLSALLYAVFELVQADISGSLLIWDSLLDWSAVTLGAVLAAGLWGGSLRPARAAVLALGIIAAAGAWVRRGRK